MVGERLPWELNTWLMFVEMSHTSRGKQGEGEYTNVLHEASTWAQAMQGPSHSSPPNHGMGTICPLS
ncbi:MAG: hypothetical protein Ct9H90mP21_2570 [Methanobacteriota archaeon]|nr:MAG: hypothetical protein Ct9H90mP21_2570 [Euryarchaeota archaeon]